MLACAGLRRGPITSARAGSLDTQPASIECKLIAESKNRLCSVLKMSPDCSPRCCNTDSAKLPAITTITQPSSGGRSHLHLRARTRNHNKEHKLRAHSCKAFASLQSRQRTQHSESWCQNMSGSKRTKDHRRLAHERFMRHTFNQAVQSCTTVPLFLTRRNT